MCVYRSIRTRDWHAVRTVVACHLRAGVGQSKRGKVTHPSSTQRHQRIIYHQCYLCTQLSFCYPVLCQTPRLPGTLYKLYEGHNDMRETGQLFRAQIQKLSQKSTSKIKDIGRENKLFSLRMMNDYLHRKMALEYQSDDDIRLITTIFNALTKSTSNVEINATSFSYVKGLSADERLHEYIRLRTLAEGSSVRGVSTPDRVDQ